MIFKFLLKYLDIVLILLSIYWTLELFYFRFDIFRRQYFFVKKIYFKFVKEIAIIKYVNNRIFYYISKHIASKNFVQALY